MSFLGHDVATLLEALVTVVRGAEVDCDQTSGLLGPGDDLDDARAVAVHLHCT